MSGFSQYSPHPHHQPRGNPMTLSEIRRAIDALKRRFATELAIIKTRRIAEAVSNDWDPDQPPEPHDVIQRFVKAGCRLPTFANLAATSTTPDARATSPNPATWSSTCSPGLTPAATAISSTGTSPPPHASHALPARSGGGCGVSYNAATRNPELSHLWPH